jgi:hypothetical protein
MGRHKDDALPFHIRLNEREHEFLNLMIYKHGIRSKTSAIRACIQFTLAEYEKKLNGESES